MKTNSEKAAEMRAKLAANAEKHRIRMEELLRETIMEEKIVQVMTPEEFIELLLSDDPLPPAAHGSYRFALGAPVRTSMH